MKASVVLPTYNEADNIVPLVQSVTAHMPAGWDYEILVVDDSSPDGTYETVRRTFASDAHVMPVLRTTDRGLAKSIRTGVEKAGGDYVIIMDTDFNHDPADIPRMLHLAQVCDVVVGSRFCPGGSMPDVWHYCLSLLYNWFIRVVLRTQIQDNLSGYLAAKKTSLEELPYDQIFFGYGDYCFRLLHYAQRSGLQILEMPVRYKQRQKGESKSVFWRLFLSYTRALLKLRFGSAFRPLPK